MYTRFRVRAPHKSWAAKGPDLLRTRSNAVKATGELLPVLRRYRVRVMRADGRFGEWSKPVSRRRALSKLENWQESALGSADALFQVGRGKWAIEPVAIVRAERFRRLDVANCSEGVTLVWSLVRHQFPSCAFGGGYVYKETTPGFYSDHAHGDAVDASLYSQNDEGTDWLVRMAQEGLTPIRGYIIGSVNGHVVSAHASRDFAVVRGGGDSSHTWHIHVSVIDHDGRKPARVGGR